MLSMGYTICMIVVCAFCTFAERLLPFLIFRKGSVPNLVRYLGNILPVAVMATLVIYCLRAVDLSSWAGFMPQLIAVAVTAGLHFWKGNTLLCVTGRNGLLYGVDSECILRINIAVAWIAGNQGKLCAYNKEIRIV